MGSRKSPKPPAATAQEKAFARRSEVSLDKELEEENRRKKLLVRNTLGTGSLLSGLPSGGGAATFSGTSFASRSGGGRGTGGGTTGATGGGSGGTAAAKAIASVFGSGGAAGGRGGSFNTLLSV